MDAQLSLFSLLTTLDVIENKLLIPSKATTSNEIPLYGPFKWHISNLIKGLHPFIKPLFIALNESNNLLNAWVTTNSLL